MGPSADARSKVRSCRVRCPKVSESQGSWPQHWVLVFIAPSWRDLLARPAHTRALQSWCSRCRQPQEQRRSQRSWRLKHTGSEKSLHFPRFPEGDVQGQQRYRTPPPPQAWWGAVSLSQREQTCQHAFIFHISHVPSSVLSPWVCRRRGGVEWGLQRKIGLYLCPLVASGLNSFYILTVCSPPLPPPPPG